MGRKVKITTLVENTACRGELVGEHGLAYFIESGENKILFDTGQSDLLLKNARAMGINLKAVDTIVLSHGHYDHTGGLATVLDEVRQVDLYMHPAALEPKFSCQKGQPSRKIGMPVPAVEYIRGRRNIRDIIWTEEPTEIHGVFTATGRVPRNTNFEDVGGPFFLDADGSRADLLFDDQSIFFESSKGLVVILGCTHSGIVNTLDYVAKLSGGKQIYAVFGGMHLYSASDERIERTIDAFRRYDVRRIGPAHCTGTKAVAKFWEALPDRCFECSAGTVIDFD